MRGLKKERSQNNHNSKRLENSAKKHFDGKTIDYLLKTRRIRLSNVSRLLKSARSGEEKWKGK